MGSQTGGSSALKVAQWAEAPNPRTGSLNSTEAPSPFFTKPGQSCMQYPSHCSPGPVPGATTPPMLAWASLVPALGACRRPGGSSVGSSMAPLFHSWLHTQLQEAPAPHPGLGCPEKPPTGPGVSSKNSKRDPCWEALQDGHSTWAQGTPLRGQPCFPSCF